MAQETAISWTDLSWNPTHGCSRVSTGCLHCYAETLSLRYGQTPKPWTALNAPENVLLKPHKLREPLSNAKAWRGLGDAAAAAGKTDGKMVFVNSMSDLFHEQIPDEYIAQVFAVMATAARHTFQVLTKRPERMRDLLSSAMFWPAVAEAIEAMGGNSADTTAVWGTHSHAVALANCWLGVSIENRKWIGRADILRETPAAVRFISAEPLLGDLTDQTLCPLCGGMGCWDCGQRGMVRGPDALDLTGIDWLILGGESGKGHRPLDVQWMRDLRDAAEAQGARYGTTPSTLYQPRCALFVKQLGGARPGTALGDLPEDLRRREFPR